jgi:hypothetical protein
MFEAGMVVHACNPSYSGGRDRIKVQSQLWQKVSKTPPKQINQVWWSTPIIPDTQEA